MPDTTRTYQSRISQLFVEPGNAYASLMDQVEHKLFADLCRGKEVNDLKSSYLIQYGITARQFNAIRISIEGKIERKSCHPGSTCTESNQACMASMETAESETSSGANSAFSDGEEPILEFSKDNS